MVVAVADVVVVVVSSHTRSELGVALTASTDVPLSHGGVTGLHPASSNGSLLNVIPSSHAAQTRSERFVGGCACSSPTLQNDTSLHSPWPLMSWYSVAPLHVTQGVAPSLSASIDPGAQFNDAHGPEEPGGAKMPCNPAHDVHGVLGSESWSVKPNLQKCKLHEPRTSARVCVPGGHA